MSKYVVVFPDGKEYFGEDKGETGFFKFSVDDLAREAVRKSGIRSPRKNPIQISVRVFRLEIEKGQLVRHLVKNMSIQPYLEDRTKEEYETELKQILAEIPKEFQSFVSGKAWDDGHSSGYEEVLSIASDLVGDLKPCIDVFMQRFLNS